MRHLLMDPNFPDLVGEWAADEAAGALQGGSANDNESAPDLDELSDPLLTLVAKAEIAATRLW